MLLFYFGLRQNACLFISPLRHRLFPLKRLLFFIITFCVTLLESQ